MIFLGQRCYFQLSTFKFFQLFLNRFFSSFKLESYWNHWPNVRDLASRDGPVVARPVAGAPSQSSRSSRGSGRLNLKVVDTKINYNGLKKRVLLAKKGQFKDRFEKTIFEIKSKSGLKLFSSFAVTNHVHGQLSF